MAKRAFPRSRIGVRVSLAVPAAIAILGGATPAFAPSNSPPDCSSAVADPDLLWPPDLQFADIFVVGVTDPDGDPISFTIGSIFQDEAVAAQGVGAPPSVPDALGVGTDLASVRAERNGNPGAPGNGRVYHVAFSADDGLGGTCSGSVLVCVPHDERGPSSSCVDDGPLFDSTLGPACGAGFELALLLPVLMALHRRRGRRRAEGRVRPAGYSIGLSGE